MKDQLELKSGNLDPVGPSALGNYPSSQWSLRPAFDLLDKLGLGHGATSYGALPNRGLLVTRRWTHV